MSSKQFQAQDLSLGWTIFGVFTFGVFLMSIPYTCYKWRQYIRLARENFIKKRHPRLTILFSFCLKLMVLVRLIDCLLEYGYIPYSFNVQNILKVGQPCILLPATFTKLRC